MLACMWPLRNVALEESQTKVSVTMHQILDHPWPSPFPLRSVRLLFIPLPLAFAAASSCY